MKKLAIRTGIAALLGLATLVVLGVREQMREQQLDHEED